MLSCASRLDTRAAVVTDGEVGVEGGEDSHCFLASLADALMAGTVRALIRVLWAAALKSAAANEDAIDDEAARPSGNGAALLGLLSWCNR